MALIKLNNQSLSNVTSAGLPSGTVLQVKSVSHNTEYDITSTSGEDIGLSITITPTSSNSKFLLLGKVGCSGASGSFMGILLFRDSTQIGGGSGKTYNAYQWNYVVADAGTDNSSQVGIPINYLDSPATTSSITYKVQAGVSSGTAGINHRNSSDDTNTTSQFTVMEIAG